MEWTPSPLPLSLFLLSVYRQRLVAGSQSISSASLSPFHQARTFLAISYLYEVDYCSSCLQIHWMDNAYTCL
ncbi:hypothetical protein GGI35DRAFT_445713 [Trichoderma velutinum]